MCVFLFLEAMERKSSFLFYGKSAKTVKIQTPYRVYDKDESVVFNPTYHGRDQDGYMYWKIDDSTDLDMCCSDCTFHDGCNDVRVLQNFCEQVLCNSLDFVPDQSIPYLHRAFNHCMASKFDFEEFSLFKKYREWHEGRSEYVSYEFFEMNTPEPYTLAQQIIPLYVRLQDMLTPVIFGPIGTRTRSKYAALNRLKRICVSVRSSANSQFDYSDEELDDLCTSTALDWIVAFTELKEQQGIFLYNTQIVSYLLWIVLRCFKVLDEANTYRLEMGYLDFYMNYHNLCARTPDRTIAESPEHEDTSCES